MAKSFGENIKNALLPANPVLNAVLWGSITLAGVLGIFYSYYFVNNFFFVEGEVSDVTIEADKSVTYEDTARTEANRQSAAERVGDIYVFDSAVLEGQVDQLNQLFRAWEELAMLPDRQVTGAEMENEGEDGPGSLLPQAETKLERAAPYIAQLQIRENTARAILDMDSITLQALRSEAESIIRQQWTKGVRNEEVEEARRRILDEVYLRVNLEEQVSFLQAAFRFIDLKANFIYDEETTLRAKEDAAEREPAVINTVYRNQRIIGKGEIVSAHHLEMLAALGYQRSEAPYIMLIGVTLLICCVFFLLSRYIRQYPPGNLKADTHNALPALLFLLILGIARLIVAINVSPESVIAEQVAYLIPASTGAILTAILMNNWLGIFFSAVISIFIGLLSGGNISYAAVAFCGCLIGVYGISRYTNRSEWAKAGLMIALVNVWMIIGFGILNNHPRTAIVYGAIIGAVNGFFSPILAYGSLPFLESIFEITTGVSLMELSDSRQPLLKELLLKAPGTYHHSILVGNLAEAAADEIGADPVLVRVGAYYHDIGKTKRPYFFIENQMADANPHERLTPALSALILNSHVKDGLEIGRKGKLPEKVLDFISQHHGEGLMAYFYRKAQEEAADPENMKDSDFRYPGPRPQSKETALVMLADSVEAAIRSMHVTGDKIEAVKKIINEKMADGQLEDSHLSLTDLKTIAQVFTKVLNGIYHNRIEYPDNVLAVMETEEEPALAEAQHEGEQREAGPDDGSQPAENPFEAEGQVEELPEAELPEEESPEEELPLDEQIQRELPEDITPEGMIRNSSLPEGSEVKEESA